MFNKNIILGLLVLIFITIVFVITFIIKNTSNFRSIKNIELNEYKNTEVDLQKCIEMELLNIKNNEEIRKDELSVIFYEKPSETLIKELAKKYELELIQSYNDPNVVFKVNKEKIPIIKCQLINEKEVQEVEYIKDIVVPLDEEIPNEVGYSNSPQREKAYSLSLPNTWYTNSDLNGVIYNRNEEKIGEIGGVFNSENSCENYYNKRFEDNNMEKELRRWEEVVSKRTWYVSHIDVYCLGTCNWNVYCTENQKSIFTMYISNSLVEEDPLLVENLLSTFSFK